MNKEDLWKEFDRRKTPHDYEVITRFKELFMAFSEEERILLAELNRELKSLKEDFNEFKKERAELNALLERFGFLGGFNEMLDLAAINNKLWDLEDELRGHSKGKDYAYGGHVAFEIQCLNDLRAAKVREINKRVGIDRKEKQHEQ